MKPRRGTSLVEILALVTGCATLLSLSALLLHRSMRWQEQTRYFFAVERAALRLTEQFREDVHRAGAIELDESQLGDDAFVQLQLSGEESVAYCRQGAEIIRILYRNGATTARERYTLAATGDLSVREELSPRRLVLTFESSPDDWLPTSDKPRPGLREQPITLRVEAAIGHDARHAPQAADAEDPS